MTWKRDLASSDGFTPNATSIRKEGLGVGKRASGR